MLQGPPDPVEGISPALARVLARAYARRPADRFASAADMARALRNLATQQYGSDQTVVRRTGAEPTIGRPGESARFRQDMAVHRLAPAAIEGVIRDLAQHLGPIARVVVNRAAREADSVEALRDRVAQEIRDEHARAAFRRRTDRR
jgi:serine/threonine-protein kinase